MSLPQTYRVSAYALGATGFVTLLLGVIFKWSDPASMNFMGGDAGDYYSSLVSLFIDHDFLTQQKNEWFLLRTSEGVVNVHPVGIALLQLPLFMLALWLSPLLGLSADGYSLLFQLSVAFTAFVSAMTGLYFLRRLLIAEQISDKVTACVIPLLFFGTNLLHYTLAEPGMSHIHSFGLISAFLFFSGTYIRQSAPKHLMLAGLFLGLIVLVRPNNVFVLLAPLLWFRSGKQLFQFMAQLLQNRWFYFSLASALLIFSLQSLVWYLQTGHFFQDTYRRDGFYWSDPQLLNMLFGFDNGFFIYTPLCLLLLAGLIPFFRENRFGSVALLSLLAGLFYFFSSYWAYTYFDGFGIRVLVDYYVIFGLLGAKLFAGVQGTTAVITGAAATLLLMLNLVYTWQASSGILLRAGMTYQQWKYVFLKTDASYSGILGGLHETRPFSEHPPVLLDLAVAPARDAFDFNGKEYGPAASVKRIGAVSNRLFVELDCQRQEKSTGSSSSALVCISVEGQNLKKQKSYVQFPLNEYPADTCCEPLWYHYTATLVGDFAQDDKLTAYIWNPDKKAFLLKQLAIKVYDYQYNLNKTK